MDYLSDPRSHFVALAQLQRYVAAALRQLSLPGEESRLRREARTLWSAVAFAEQFGIDLEPLLATVGPPTPAEGRPAPAGRLGLEQCVPSMATVPTAEPVEPAPLSFSTGPAPPPAEESESGSDPAGRWPLAVAAALLVDSVELRLRLAAARRAATAAPAGITREAGLGVLPRADVQLEAARRGMERRDAEDALRWELGEAEEGGAWAAVRRDAAEAEAEVEARAEVGMDATGAWVAPELFLRDSAEALEHARRKSHAQRRRVRLEAQALEDEVRAAACRAVEQVGGWLDGSLGG